MTMMRARQINRIKDYLYTLKKWKDHGGLEGLGGQFDRTTKKYTAAPCPTPEEFGIDDPWLLKQCECEKKKLLQ